MHGPKLALYGAGMFVGGIGLAVLLGAIGAEWLWRYYEGRS